MNGIVPVQRRGRTKFLSWYKLFYEDIHGTQHFHRLRIMKFLPSILSVLFFAFLLAPCNALIPRKALVSRFNPTRNASSTVTPMQVGNGNFAFGADVTGLQTFQPFGILSFWGWKNDSFPPGVNQTDIDNYKGVSWLNHGRPVQYDFDNGDPIEQWLISNPNRVNLGRVGLLFLDEEGNVQSVVEEGQLNEKMQELDLWTGIISSTFLYAGQKVTVRTACAQDSDIVSVELDSPLVSGGRLAIFLDFPWNDGSAKFSAPFVGNWSAPDLHTTSLTIESAKYTDPRQVQAEITHVLDGTLFYTSLAGDEITVERQSHVLHRYNVRPTNKHSSTFSLSVAFANTSAMNHFISSPVDTFQSSTGNWEDYWSKSGFVDVLTGSTDTRAEELQRRVILSRYLMRVNEAGDTPPQEVSIACWLRFNHYVPDKNLSQD